MIDMEINEIKITRILNPTSIDLGEFVINPYKGCSLGCLYCYVKFNKVVMKETREWGSYVDVRVNAPDQLQKELVKHKPKRVLMGSTTECFQPIERQYKITAQILELLNKNGVYYNILTRSPIILDYIPLLNQGYCEKIYFTVNNYDDSLKKVLEPGSDTFDKRIDTINKLLENKIPVIPYFSPILPFISNTDTIFDKITGTDTIEFEGLNFNLGNITKIVEIISLMYPELKQKYEQLSADNSFYDLTWNETKTRISNRAKQSNKKYNIYVHNKTSYFENKYR
jgi:DNA repair photolyase